MTELVYRLAQVARCTIPTSVTEQEASRLSELARERRVLEIGSAFGFSTITMALVAETVVTVDPHDGRDALANPSEGTMLRGSLETLQAHMWAAGVTGKVRIYVGWSQDLLPRMIKRGHRFDLVFVDGDHSYGATREDLVNGWELLAPGGVLAVHDYGEVGTPAVPLAVDSVFQAGGDRLTDSLWEIAKA